MAVCAGASAGATSPHRDSPAPTRPSLRRLQRAVGRAALCHYCTCGCKRLTILAPDSQAPSTLLPLPDAALYPPGPQRSCSHLHLRRTYITPAPAHHQTLKTRPRASLTLPATTRQGPQVPGRRRHKLLFAMPEPLQHLSVVESTGLRRKDTTKGPPLRILSLGQSHPKTLSR